MIFNSIHFVLFFVVVTPIYFLLAHKSRWWWLLAASCYFYMVFKPIYILILGFTIVIDYFAGLFIEKSEGKRRRNWLIISLIANIGVLAIFKYYNFFFHFVPNAIWEVNMERLGVPYLWIALPVGLSFHTFQAMSYTIEVYRGNQKAERHFGLYSLYVMFYPQLVAGPIERPQNILHQFKEKKFFDYERVVSGLQLMAWGIFKKVVIADRLAAFVDKVYDSPENYQGPSVFLATFFFSFQIYCDFSGYSDIAIGSAKIMGFDLMKNFEKPYFATSISDFWRRWHISLSTWFRDYLYIPLGGNRVSKWKNYRNQLIVFVTSGLWHGANFNYLIWGGLHGIYLIVGLVTKDFRNSFVKKIGLTKYPKLHHFLNVVSTFLLVTFAWLWFRADYFSRLHMKIIFLNLFKGWGEITTYFQRPVFSKYVLMEQELKEFILAILLIIFLETIHIIQLKGSIREMIRKQKSFVRWMVYTVFIISFIIFGVFESKSQFIYFQF